MSRREPVACGCGRAPALLLFCAWAVALCGDCYHSRGQSGPWQFGRDAAIDDWNEKRELDRRESEAQS